MKLSWNCHGILMECPPWKGSNPTPGPAQNSQNFPVLLEPWECDNSLTGIFGFPIPKTEIIPGFYPNFPWIQQVPKTQIIPGFYPDFPWIQQIPKPQNILLKKYNKDVTLNK